MAQQKTSTTQLKSVVSFGGLLFRIPHTEKSKYDPTKTVFFHGVKNKRGVVTVKYNDLVGKQRLKITCVKDMLDGARTFHTTLKKIGVTNALYAFTPVPVGSMKQTKNVIWKGYLEEAIDCSYEIVRPWLQSEEGTVPFPTEQLAFFEPFSSSGHRRSWNFYDVRNRWGIYLIREDGIVVRVGLSSSLHNRPKAYFYPLYDDISRENARYRVSYYEKMMNGEHQYEMATVSLPAKEFVNRKALKACMKNLEKKAIRCLKPRDNIKEMLLEEIEDLPF